METDTMEITELAIIDTAELKVIEKTRAEEIVASFRPMVEMLNQHADDYNEILSDSGEGVTMGLVARAKRLRLDIVKVRTTTSKIKDKQKESIKLEGNAIMGVHNIIVSAVKDKEDSLQQIEDHFASIERERVEALQKERAAEMFKYTQDIEGRDFAAMDDEMFNALLFMKKTEAENKLKEEESARIQKEKDDQEREELRLANQKLKEEADAKQKIIDEQEQVERARVLQRDRDERDRVLQKEKEEREAKEKEEARIQAELSKGDADKLLDLISDLKAIQGRYVFKSKVNQKIFAGVTELLDKVIAYINGISFAKR